MASETKQAKGVSMANIFRIKPLTFRVECLECGAKFRTQSMIPECKNCGSTDVELAEEFISLGTVRREGEAR
jgi:DNA polymerase II large subunit